MKILLHICCAPCTVYPAAALTAMGHQVRGFFFNPNISPIRSSAAALPPWRSLRPRPGCPLSGTAVIFWKSFCGPSSSGRANGAGSVTTALKATARVAKGGKFDAFTSTLLYSKFQNHEMIREIGHQVVQEVGVPFYYDDFRPGWAEGMAKSKKMGLYKQQYCGCIFSERDRFLQRSQPSRGMARGRGDMCGNRVVDLPPLPPARGPAHRAYCLALLGKASWASLISAPCALRNSPRKFQPSA